MNQHTRAPGVPRLDDVERDLRAAGFTPRGAFRPVAADDVPQFSNDAPVRTVLLAGNAGPHMWRAFEAACAAGPSGLDDWSERTLGALAARWGARAVYPFSKPYVPFQRWAMRAEPCHVSPVAMLVHPDYGLWHAYRGALLFECEMALPEPDVRPSPCEGCKTRACLSACPVSAFSSAGYDVAACAGHLHASPRSACVKAGCLVRHACPVGRDYRYEPAQAQFHMRAFIKSHGGD